MTEDHSGRRLDRRAFMAAVGATGATAAIGTPALATGRASGTDVADATFVAGYPGSIADLQFNPFNYMGLSPVVSDVVFDRLARYNVATGEFVPSLLSDWEIGTDRVELRVRDGATWHNGDPVTGRDVAMQFELELFTDSDVADHVADVGAFDDRSVVLKLEGPTNETLLKQRILDRRLAVKNTEYRDFFTRGQTDPGAARDDLRAHRVESPIGNGPFAFASRSDRRIRFERFADHPDAGNVAFDAYVFEQHMGAHRVRRALRDGAIDGAADLPAYSDAASSLPDSHVRAQIKNPWGLGFAFDHDDDHVGQREVRQAMMHVIDTGTVADSVAEYRKRPVDRPTGLAPWDADRVLGDAVGSFDAYDSQSTAASLLREVGYTKTDGRWRDGDGEALSVPITAPSGWGDWQTAIEDVVSQLRSFGFDASIEATDSYFVDATDGNYTVVADSWLPGIPDGYVPYNALRTQFEGTYTGDGSNYPREPVTVPARDGEGTTSVDVYERLSRLESAADPGTAADLVDELAWVVNQTLPMVPIMTRYTSTVIDGSEWDVPPADDTSHQVRWPTTWLVRTGDLSPTDAAADGDSEAEDRGDLRPDDYGDRTPSGNGTSTATPTPNGTSTATQTPTATPTADPAPTPTPTETSTAEPAPTATPTATQTANEQSTVTERDQSAGKTSTPQGDDGGSEGTGTDARDSGSANGTRGSPTSTPTSTSTPSKGDDSEGIDLAAFLDWLF